MGGYHIESPRVFASSVRPYPHFVPNVQRLWVAFGDIPGTMHGLLTQSPKGMGGKLCVQGLRVIVGIILRQIGAQH